jgi:hypothetical protein
MSTAAEVWAGFTAAQEKLDAALGLLDAQAILTAAADLHGAAAQLAQPGLVTDEDRLAAALNAALKRIESCRLRVMFLADHTAQRVANLTHGQRPEHRWRPDRAA